ncbi:MAG: hypothetical protein ACI36X_06465 [Bacteroidaceae bacterium]
MRRKNVFHTALNVCVFSLALSACVDNDYDLSKDVDLTIQVGGDLTLPGCNTEEITLKDVFDLDESDPDNIIQADKDGWYALRKDGTGSNSTVNVSAVDVRDVTSQQVLSSLNFPMAVLSATGEAESVIDGDPSELSITNDEVPLDIVRIVTARPEKVIAVVAKIYFDRTGNNVKKLNLKDDFRVYIPKFLNAKLDEARLKELGMENAYKLAAATTMPASISGQASHYDVLSFVSAQAITDAKGLEIPLLVEELAFDQLKSGQGILPNNSSYKKLYINDELVIAGTVLLKSSEQDIAITEDIAMKLHTDIVIGDENSAVKFRITEVEGVVDPDIDVTVDPVSFDNLPDFLADDEVKMDLTNPKIFLTIRNEAPVDVNIKGSLRSYKGNALLKTVAIGKELADAETANAILIKGNSTTTICLSRQGTGADTSKGEVNVKVENLNDVIETIPDEITLTDIEAKVLPKVYDFQLGQTFHVETSYQVNAPLAFGEKLNIVYRDSIDGWNEDIADNDIEVKKVEIVMQALNKIPLAMKLHATPVDAEGNTISDIEVSDIAVIAPGNGLQGDGSTPKASELKVDLTLKKEGAMRRLDGLKLRIEASNMGYPEFQNLPLNQNQTLKLDNIRIKIPGGVKLNLND